MLTLKLISLSLVPFAPLASSAFEAGALPDDVPAPPEVSVDPYGSTYARLLSGELSILRADGTSEPAEANAPLLAGDWVATDGDHRAEIQLADASRLYVDYDTELELQSLADATASLVTTNILRIDRGAIYVDGDVSGADLRIDSDHLSAAPRLAGSMRLDRWSDETQVTCRRGSVEVYTVDQTLTLNAGEHAHADTSSLSEPDIAAPFDDDDFDHWHRDRARALGTARSSSAAADLPPEVEPYADELSAHGRWHAHAVHGTYWVPYSPYVGWSPYCDGYWNWCPTGWMWISYDPWGWAPYRYGHWDWWPGHGWVWIPSRTWCGGWVSWSYWSSGGSPYYGWAPRGPGSTPIYATVETDRVYRQRGWQVADANSLKTKGRVHGGEATEVLRDREATPRLLKPIQASRPHEAAPRSPRLRAPLIRDDWTPTRTPRVATEANSGRRLRDGELSPPDPPLDAGRTRPSRTLRKRTRDRGGSPPGSSATQPTEATVRDRTTPPRPRTRIPSTATEATDAPEHRPAPQRPTETRRSDEAGRRKRKAPERPQKRSATEDATPKAPTPKTPSESNYKPAPTPPNQRMMLPRREHRRREAPMPPPEDADRKPHATAESKADESPPRPRRSVALSHSPFHPTQRQPARRPAP